MRVKFPDGSGGPFEVPGVGRVVGGEEFDWPEGLPPIAGAVLPDGSPVPVGDSAGGDAAGAESGAEAGAGDDQGGGDGAAETPSEPESKTRAKGARS